MIRPPHFGIGRQAEGTACLAVRLGEGDLWSKPDRAGHRVRHAQDLASQARPKLCRLTDETSGFQSQQLPANRARSRKPSSRERDV